MDDAHVVRNPEKDTVKRTYPLYYGGPSGGIITHADVTGKDRVGY